MHPRAEDEAFARFLTTGDPEAMGSVFDAAAPRLLLLAAHLAPRGVDAEDLLQNTFIEALRSAATFDRSRHVMPWLMGILTHQARRARRQSARTLDRDRMAPARAVADPADLVADAEFAAAFEEALQDLAGPTRRFLVLHLVHGLSHGQIAQSEGAPPGTVKSRLRRGLERLRRALPAGFVGAAILSLSPISQAQVRARVVDQARTTTTVPASGRRPHGSPWLLATAVGAIAVIGAWLTFRSLQVVEPPAPSRGEPAQVATALTAEGAPARRAVASGAPAPSTTIDVEVRWRDDGSPAVGIPVLLCPDRPANLERALRLAATGRDGRVRFRRDPLVASIAVAPAVERVVESVDIAAGTDIAAHLASGRFTIPGTPEASVALTDPTTDSIALDLPRLGTIHGAVVDAEGEPLAGARIFACADPTAARAIDTGVRTDVLGRFTLPLWCRTLSLHAVIPGAAPSDREVVRASSHGDPPAVRLIAGGPAGSLIGRVQSDTGRPVPNAVVWAEPREVRTEPRPPNPHFPRLTPSQFAITDGHGRFRFADLPLGATLVRAAHQELGSGQLVAEVHRDSMVETAVTLRDPDGGRPSWSPFAAPPPVLQPRVTDPDAAPPTLATIHGELVPPAGSALRSPWVEFRSLDDGTTCTNRADAQGHVASDPLPPGHYRVRARDLHLPWTDFGVAEVREAPVLLGPLTLDRPVPVTLGIAVSRGALPWDLHAHVLDERGDIVQHARIRETSARIDVPPLGPHRYTLQVGGSMVAWTQHPLDLRDHAPHVDEITVHRGISTRLRFEPTEAPPERLDLELLDDAGSVVVVATLSSAQVRNGISCGLPVAARILRVADDRGRTSEMPVNPSPKRRNLLVPLP